MALAGVVRDIKTLRIQGAEAIARAGLRALAEEAARSRKGGLVGNLRRASRKLVLARPTEPMLRNVISRLIVLSSEAKGRGEFLAGCDALGKELLLAKEKVIGFASQRISSSRIVFTHCHSSTVSESIIKGFRGRKDRKVICTETRPLYQGLKTAREMGAAGIPVALVVDSASRLMMKEADIVLIGADAITANGAVINKIGSGMIASLAHELRKPLLVCSSTYKFDPLTAKGYLEPMEERRPEEVLPKAIRGVGVFNPAFEAVAPDRIDSIITEFGLVHPSDITNLIREKRPWMLREL